MTRVEPIRRTSTAEAIVEHLLGRIRAGQFGPGDWLPSERLLQEQLGVGRLSLREALARLSALGIIRVDHGKGAWCIFYEQGWGQDELFAAGDKLLLELAGELDISVAACRTAWQEIRKQRLALELHNLPDRTHPGTLGKYVNMCCLYEAITGESPVG